ncbi:hypothetical protein HanPSC8_Chr10g0409141 [Helianthus annuus]|nr:hypothetical protein HanPSC8_Chr10g0409141 [Helianthus annuus]
MIFVSKPVGTTILISPPFTTSLFFDDTIKPFLINSPSLAAQSLPVTVSLPLLASPIVVFHEIGTSHLATTLPLETELPPLANVAPPSATTFMLKKIKRT